MMILKREDLLDQLHEETLDPADWETLRQLGHRMVDDALEHMATARQRPVWQPVPEEVARIFEETVPQKPQGVEQTYEDFLNFVLAYPMGNTHPRFWGWVMGTGTPLAALADMLAATVNPNMAGGNHAGNLVEIQVINWLKGLMGFPDDASGLLVSGGSMANLTGLTVARNAKAGFDIRKQGLQNAPKRLTLYASREAHSSVQKAVELLGLGSVALRLVDVNEDFTINLGALEAMIQADLAVGHRPFCVVGNAGTVNTGAVDELDALADLCQQYDLWLHVDGAFGALAMLTDYRTLLSGIERADSLAFDLHKWMYMPFEAGCVLVRHESAHRHTFSLTPDYLTHDNRGIAGGFAWLSDYGVQLSRGFRALKVWMSLKAEGIEKFGRLIQQNIEQAQYLAGQIDASTELERLAPVSLNVVCFRFNPGGLSEAALNRLNEAILFELQERGIAAISSTRLHNRFVLRGAITNHRSQREDFDVLVESVLKLGHELAAQVR